MRLPLLGLGAGLALALAAAAPSGAATLGFGCITGSRAADCAIGEAQLQVEVSDAGGGAVDFSFRNSGPAASSITDIYWDDDALLALFSIHDMPGVVEFSQWANPGNLPGAELAIPHFQTSWGLSVDSDAPVQPMGVNPGESLRVSFMLLRNQTFADALAQLGDGSLRVGIHVQGYASGGSESFVNSAPVPVPEPGTLPLVGAGMLGLRLARRRG